MVAGKRTPSSGASSTDVRTYGAAGCPHLHLTTFYGPREEFLVMGMYHSREHAEVAVLDDLLILLLAGVDGLNEVRDLPADRRELSPAKHRPGMERYRA